MDEYGYWTAVSFPDADWIRELYNKMVLKNYGNTEE